MIGYFRTFTNPSGRHTFCKPTAPANRGAISFSRKPAIDGMEPAIRGVPESTGFLTCAVSVLKPINGNWTRRSWTRIRAK